ncbi:hypothetical protein [Nocardia sp. NRRL S-836]|uniref:hypothetical protein n=1 Tax=Nocardia sp. NRRL S-836 TaxID=1519492 RepID=UPI0006AF3F37|nr:hypothetical protein [Nocardia sp. NRRL S-836]KOV83118.1 hypothetical protein ADL03_21340 [Nocardia sp. NRRL S-836]
MSYDGFDSHEQAQSGFEQIVFDEFRRQQRNVSDLGVQWGLSAVGHQLQTQPTGVEWALELIVTHGDERVLVSAASLMASILLDGVPRDQLMSPVKIPVSFALPGGVDAEDRLAWQENVKVASAVVSAFAARDAAAIEKAISVLRGEGAFEVMVVLVSAAARTLERHAAWLIEAMRCAGMPATEPTSPASDT